IPVQEKVFDVLAYLIEHRERFVSPEELLAALWSDVSVGPASVSQAVHKARQAVGDDGGHQTVLRTKHGHGFRFVADASVVSTAAMKSATPAGFRARWVAVAGIPTLLLVALVAWLLIRPVAETATIRSVAVLPLENLSDGPEYFADGMTEMLITNLAKIRALKVIARTTIDRLDPELGVQEIGRKLDVATVLEGSVQRAGDRIRINVQLIDSETESHVWAETYDRELTAANIFAIQSEIASNVADALRATLSQDEQDQISTIPTESLAAYNAYLLGKQRLAKMTSDSLAEAGALFRQAIELDPGFALAYVGLADVYVEQVYSSALPLNELLGKAQAAVDKALELDDHLGEAYSSLGNIKAETFDPEGAMAAYRRALELSPNYATVYTTYGYLMRVDFGRPEEALALHRRAIELDPLSLGIVDEIGRDLFALGRSDEALRWWKRAVESDPGLAVYSSASIADHYWYALARADEAAIWYTKSISLDPGDPARIAQLGILLLDLGDLDAAEYWIGRSIEMGPESIWPNWALIRLHLYRDDEASVAYVRKLPEGVLPSRIAYELRRFHEIKAGRYSEVRALYEKIVPELLTEDSPEINGRKRCESAIALALPLSKLGERERADLLLKRSLQYIHTVPRLGRMGHWIADVQIYALQGEKQKALAALRQAIDEGWRAMWWYYFQREPNLESLHDEPEFQAMVAEIEADMVAQLTRVRELERNGELQPIPEVSATIQ
ncbi:MAG: winged helix-turn-helix domain-containing protein, partial [Deltaproteobacteria bacterium]|nr:winged helix-turn-helix domain-containing protein [Deltaproteobacteria bacterium]